MWNSPPTGAPMPYMLNERHFVMILCLALSLHVLALVGYSIVPKQKVQDIVVRTLNIRLGEGDDQPAEMVQAAMPAQPVNAPEIDAIVDKITGQDAAPPREEAVKQYVRETNMPRSKESRKTGKSGAKDAEIMSRYTQMISLWVKKFQVNPEGEDGTKMSTVVRIRIDRRGNIRYYALERSTGSELFDRAAIDMIRRANPVPAVPDDYPAGETFEFLIGVNFSL